MRIILDSEDFGDYIDAVDNEANEISTKLGPPRLTRLDADVDAEVMRLAEAQERPVAAVLRRLVKRAVRIPRRVA